MTINPNFNLSRIMTFKDLHAATYLSLSSFAIEMMNEEFLFADKIVRLVPKRRMVIFGKWQEREVVAKLFFDARKARQHMQKESAGLKILADNKIPSPIVYYQGKSKDKRIYILILERVLHAKNLKEMWEEEADKKTVHPWLLALMIELATQHVLGILQKDLHLNNFLASTKKIFTLDGAQIKAYPMLLSKKISIENLAVCLSQLGGGCMALQEELFLHYATSRGWRLKVEDFLHLHYLIKKINTERARKLNKKIFRESTEFGCINNWFTQGMYNRHYLTPAFLKLLADPEASFRETTTTILKAGNSATVAKVHVGTEIVIIKRYNIKNAMHFFRRVFRHTRARHAWRIAQKLHLFGVRTPLPIAYVEKKFLNLHGKSYLITEYVQGENASSYFLDENIQMDMKKSLIKSIAQLLKIFPQLEMTHGDLKITNILIDEKNQPCIIDLDGTFEHCSISSLHHAWQHEVKRFLDNFKDKPHLQLQFKMELEKDSLNRVTQ